ncbi:ferritin-like domain-containing protein [Nocardioides sp.]|uniref:ferritin-like domain-containing protein n=1 Tax=Nocardioides sp. TaxID=35761 RepID=UPI00286E52E8|nr:ferritin-like domain-containing protein [Nocardioides sp.]
MSTLESLQATLAAEHAAIFVYGDAGAHTSQSAEPALFETISTLYRTHRARRDQLRLLIADRGATPVASAATYVVPSRLGSPVAVRRHALRTEQGCAEGYAALVANTAGPDRDWAIGALIEAAQARIQLDGAPETFPGAPELG